MTSAALILSLLLSFSGFAALALSLDRHHRAAYRVGVPKARVGSLRMAGWCGLGLSFAAAVAAAVVRKERRVDMGGSLQVRKLLPILPWTG